MLPMIDIIVMGIYLTGVVLFGCWFYRKSANTSAFMTACGSLPAWAVGLSIFGTYLSSNTFLGVPGKAYSSNWNAFVFSLSLPLAAWLATRFFVPFYRQSGEVSAYQHLEHRFGSWARTYAVVCYLLTQFARTGTILFGVSLALSALTGWDQFTIIVIAGILITLYTLVGGIEAVIWTDVVQSLVLMSGALVILALILVGLPEGPTQVFSLGDSENKFSLGSFQLDFTSSSFWVVLLFGVFINLSNFGIDQSFVQRYHTAKTAQDAAKSVWLGALLYIPISMIFYFIGTSAFAYYHTHPEALSDVSKQVAAQQLADEKASATDADISLRASQLTDGQIGDKILPHFIVSKLPAGIRGLLIAAIFAAAMSSIDTSLNSSATIILSDVYKRFIHPSAGERESMIVLYLATLSVGILGTAAAVALIGVDSILDAWWILSGIFAGGLLGLFLLGMISKQAMNRSASFAVVLGIVAICWMSLPKLLELGSGETGEGSLCGLNIPNWLTNPLHENMTIVIGTLMILIVGLLLAKFFPDKPDLRKIASQAPDG